MTDIDELSAARRRFPLGERVRGRVAAVPLGAGRVGVLVDLGQPPEGFVDVLHLPEDPGRWPAVGREGLFEVLQHRPGQVRLFPLDAGMRARRCWASRWSGPQWAAVAARYPVGSIVLGTVTAVYPACREYVVRFDDCLTAVEYDGAAPIAGATHTFEVTRVLEWTHRILLKASS
jgi:hypothetical protein